MSRPARSARGGWVDQDLFLRRLPGQRLTWTRPIQPGDAAPDALIATHWHEDHLDPGTVPVIARNHPATRFIMPPSAMSPTVCWGVRRDQILTLTAGQSHTVKDMTITHVSARHEPNIPGGEVPDAMGVLLQCGGLTIYNSGDTEYDVRLP